MRVIKNSSGQVLFLNNKAVKDPITNIVSGTQMNQYVTSYIAAARTAYAADPDRTTNIVTQYIKSGERRDRPVAIPLTVPAGHLTLHDKAGNASLQKDVQAGTYNAYHISPDGGEIYVSDDETCIEMKNIKPTGECRMIYVETSNNIRDLGGWPSYDANGEQIGTIRYGLIYRGADILNCTSEDKRFMVDYLKIKYEIDLGTNEQVSGFDDNVIYIPCYTSFGDSLAMVDFDYSGKHYLQVKKGVQAIMDAVAQGEASYFHCTAGADRTGSTGFILDSLLGKNEVDCDIDYELTSFSPQGARTRNGSVSLSTKWPDMVAYVKNCSTTKTLLDGVVAWCVLAGISIDDINAFRRIMIKGEVVDLEPHIASQVTELKLSSTSSTLNPGKSVTVSATRVPAWAVDPITWAIKSGTAGLITQSGDNVTIKAVESGVSVIQAEANGVKSEFTLTVQVPVPGPSLPAGYQAIEYLQSSGTQYIDTGVIPNASNMRMEQEFCFPTAPTATTCTFAVKDTSIYYSTFKSGSGVQAGISTATIGTYTPALSTFAAGKRYTNTDVIADGVLNSTLTDGTNVYTITQTMTATLPSQSAYIFASHYSDGSAKYFASMKYYKLKFWKDNELVIDMVPARRTSDNALGMYDFATSSFFVNAGTGTFIAGPDISGTTALEFELESKSIPLDTVDYLFLTRTPESATEPITYVSSDPSIFEVVSSADVVCKIKANAIGTASITASSNGASDSCEVNVETNERTVTVTSTTKGTTTGGGTYLIGQTCSLAATPNEGYEFYGWFIDGVQVSNTAQYSFTVSEDVVIVPKFIVAGIPYIALDYIQSTGTQYINPEIEGKVNMTWEGKFKYTELTGAISMIAGAHSVSGVYYNVVGVTASNYLRIDIGSTTGISTTLAEANMIYSFKTIVSNGASKLYINDNLIHTNAGTVTAGQVPLLFADSYYGTPNPTYYSKACLYGLTVHEGESLVRNLIPCMRRSDNVICMYDTVTGNFYTNKGTGVFIAGEITGEKVITVQQAAHGTATGGGTFDVGDTCTLTAIPDTGYEVYGWRRNGSIVSQSNPYTFNVDADGTYTPVFLDSSKDYIEIEYLESTGTQYIDTGIVPTVGNLNLDIKTKWASTALNNYGAVVGSTDSGNTRLLLRHYGTNAAMIMDHMTSASDNYAFTLGQPREYECLWADGASKFWIDNDLKNTYTDTNVGNTSSIYIFGRNASGAMNSPIQGRLYSLSINKNSELVRNFIPVLRKSDSMACLYDKVSGTFFTNLGAGTFIAGPITI